MLLRGCPLWILALSMRPKELFTINFGAWDPFSTRAPMNIKLRDPSHKPKLSLILLRAWVGRKNDNGHLISFYIFGQLPGRHYSPLADRPCSQQATVISQQKMAGKGAIERFGCGVKSCNFGIKYETQRIIYNQFCCMKSLFNISSLENPVMRPIS